MREIDKNKPLFFDVETVIDKGVFQKVLLAQFYQEDWDDAYILVEPTSRELYDITEGTHLIGHNISFDIHCSFGAIYEHGHLKDIDDTLLLSRLKFPAFDRYSLDYVLEK